MGRPRKADGAHTRQAILDSALDVFAEKGYFGASLRDIAAAVGVRESAFYNYFGGKDEILGALLLAERHQKAAQFDELLEQPFTDARTVLERLASLALDRFSDPRQQKLFRILMSDGMRLAREGRIDLLDRMSSSTGRLSELMRRLIDSRALRAADPALLAIEFMGPLLLWRHWHALDPANPLIADQAAFVRGHVAQFLVGAAQEAS